MADPTPEQAQQPSPAAAAAQAQYTRGPADTTGTQLPKGTAKDTNDQDQAAQAAIAQNAAPTTGGAAQPVGPSQDMSMPAGVTPGVPQTGPVNPGNERDGLLFGPTANPAEPVTAGAQLGVAPPASIHQWLPALQAAANDPSAPASLKQLFKLVMYHLQQGQ